MCQALSWLLCLLYLMESSQVYKVGIIIHSFSQMERLRFRAVSNMPEVTQLARRVASASLTLKHKLFPLLSSVQEKEHWAQKMQVPILASLYTGSMNLDKSLNNPVPQFHCL